jgi:hypothetical protein
MLTAGSLVSSATAFRLGVGWVELLVERTPNLAQTAVSASRSGPHTGRAQAAFRDDLLALARDWTEVSWREMRRGLEDFDKLTRPSDVPQPGERPFRPYRWKL